MYDSANPVVLKAVRICIRELCRESEARILDVGCGSGRLAGMLARADGHRMFGLDVAPQATITAAGRGVSATQVDLGAPRELPFAAHSFDGAILADVIEHTPNPMSTLRRVAAVVKPGGFLVISVPNVAFALARLRLLFGRFDYEDSGIFDRTHLRFFTRRTLVSTLLEAGLCVVGVDGYTLTRPGLRALRLLVRLAPGLFAFQLLAVAKTPSGRRQDRG